MPETLVQVHAAPEDAPVWTDGSGNPQEGLNVRRLFFTAVLALFTAAVSLSIRAATAANVKSDVLDGIDPFRSGEMIGSALGVSFLGFAVTLFVTSPLLNRIGMGRLLVIAGLCFILGPILVVAAPSIARNGAVFDLIWTGMLVSGVGWGCTESAINPMTAALYPVEKTHRMNILHAWWPAGLIVGGLLGFALTEFAIDWRIVMLAPLLPAVGVVALATRQRFPVTESAALGVPTIEMMGEIIRRPSFLVWFVLMFFTASTELAPGQWVDLALSHIVGMRGILLLVFVSGLMFVMRHFAGPLAHRLSPVGLLLVSSLFALAGLRLLAMASTPLSAIVAATIWGLGVCYMWPTMLATAAERYPRGGAWTMGLMGTAGALATYFVLPQLGAIYDSAKVDAAGGPDLLRTLSGPALQAVLIKAAAVSFRVISLFPLVLILAFSIIWILERPRK